MSSLSREETALTSMRRDARSQTGDESVDSIETALEEPFYIISAGPSARLRRTLKHVDTFTVFHSHGVMGRPMDPSMATRVICPASSC
jgi:hypothetical protein